MRTNAFPPFLYENATDHSEPTMRYAFRLAELLEACKPQR